MFDVRKRGLGRALSLTLAAAVLPGIAHLRSGRVRTGLTIMGVFLLLVAAVVALLTTSGGLAALAVQPAWLLSGTAWAAILAVVWPALLLHSWRVARPPAGPRWRRRAGSALAAVLSVLAGVPFVVVARAGWGQYDLISEVFTAQPVPLAAGPRGRVTEDPLDGLDRLNVLLLGSDAGPGRIGVRTDTIVLASVEVATGRTVLLSLPRNLQRAPFPPGSPAHRRFPHGFDDLLNAVWGYGTRHPELVPGAERPGAELLKSAVGRILGLPVHHYLMVDMAGFATLIDAMGGLEVTVRNRIRWGDGQVVLRPGRHRLNGEQALLLARSRTGTSDYARMARQRCMIEWILDQASPMTLIARYLNLSRAAKRMVSTDIPHTMLPSLLLLAEKVRWHPIQAVVFTPPMINSARPDYAFIRRRAQAALAAGARDTAVPRATRDNCS